MRTFVGVDRFSVVPEEIAVRLLLTVESDVEKQRLQARLNGVHRVMLMRNDRTTSEIQRKEVSGSGNGDIAQGLHFFTGVIIVPTIRRGQIERLGHVSLKDHRSDEKRRTPEELFVQRPTERVLREFMGHGTNDGSTGDVNPMKERIEKRVQRVTRANDTSMRVDDRRREDARILIGEFDSIVISKERIECSELHPTLTQLFRRVPFESADVCPHVRNRKQIEFQHADDVVLDVRPKGGVIAEPMASVGTRGGKCRSTDHDRTFVLRGTSSRKCGQCLCPSVEIVHIVVIVDLSSSIGLFSNHTQSLVRQRLAKNRGLVLRILQRFFHWTVKIPRVRLRPIPRLKFIRVEVRRFTQMKTFRKRDESRFLSLHVDPKAVEFQQFVII